MDAQLPVPADPFVIGQNPNTQMSTYHSWPDGFVDPRPVTTFGDDLTDLLAEFAESGCKITADESWSWFSISTHQRQIEFVRRGRLGFNRDYCWEVRLSECDNPVSLGTIFGIRECACVVIAGVDALSRIAKKWITGDDVLAIVQSAKFWDKMDTRKPLELSGNAAK